MKKQNSPVNQWMNQYGCPDLAYLDEQREDVLLARVEAAEADVLRLARMRPALELDGAIGVRGALLRMLVRVPLLRVGRLHSRHALLVVPSFAAPTRASTVDEGEQKGQWKVEPTWNKMDELIPLLFLYY